MEKAISEVIGRADLKEGGSTQLYRALRQLLCATCGAEISVGALFTRRKVKGINLRIMPQCQKCAPFAPHAETKEKPGLLQAILTESPAATASRRVKEPSESAPPRAEEEKLAEEVRRRLEPALKKGRNARKRE
ncbi:MAG TPA: hypothetical protein VF791_12250 [Pyrinomonadaceae bacterium]